MSFGDSSNLRGATENEKKLLGNKLSYLVDRSGKTQAEIAKDLNISRATLNNWVLGKNMPSVKMIQLMADYFHVARSAIDGSEPIQYSTWDGSKDAEHLYKYHQLTEQQQKLIDQVILAMLRE